MHRGAGDGSTDSPLSRGPEKKRKGAANEDEKEKNGNPLGKPKRRKTAENAANDESETKDLQAKVKQLEFELQQRDERLRRLEETVLKLEKCQSTF